jgi:UDP-N-acetylmuramoylalanine--D-glutamate ligase
MLAVMTKTETKRALVVGLGLTGASCVRYLVDHGYDVTGVDTRAEPPGFDALRREFPQVAFHLGGLDAALLRDPGLLVVSPGLPINDGPIAQAVAAGAQPMGDIELFARQARAPVIAITGANGKSTVTSLVGAMCQAAGLRTGIGGNIGKPALELLAAPEPAIHVLELSSFQLETTWSLNAVAATVLNLTPDHMDRYATLDDYAAAKARVFRGNGAMVLNADDARVMQLAQSGRRQVCFGLGAPSATQPYGLIKQGGDIWLACGSERLLNAREVPLEGAHNLANVLASMALAEAAGIARAAQLQAVRGFKGLPHRTELVAEQDGVRWIDDSKGTNVGATVAALEGMTAKVVLIAGGDGKGQDFSPLREPVKRHARAVVLIGRDAPQIEKALAHAVPAMHARDMREAVQLARATAQPGDVVLLSPACASFDMFRGYVHRGEVFRAAVQEVLR